MGASETEQRPKLMLRSSVSITKVIFTIQEVEWSYIALADSFLKDWISIQLLDLLGQRMLQLNLLWQKRHCKREPYMR